jgi:hypothetical protein
MVPPQAGHSTSSRIRSFATLAASATILGLLASPILWGGVYHEDDLGGFHLPLRYFYARCLAKGDDPCWFPGSFCGYYLHGDGQVGLFHPLHWALYRFLPLWSAFDLELLLNYPVVFAGTYLLLRRRNLPADAALFGAMVFSFSGFNLLHYVHPNMLAVVAQIPWLLVAIDALWSCDQPRRAEWLRAAVAALTASQLLLGHPQLVWISLLTEILYAISLSRRTSGRDLRRWAEWIGAKTLGVLCGAVQWLPTLDALASSVRADPSGRFLLQFSLHPANVIQLIGPYLFTARYFEGDAGLAHWPVQEFGLYNGAVVAVFLGWLAFRWRSGLAHRALAKGAIGLGALALLLSFGGYTPLGALCTRLPVVGLLRCPSRYIVLFHLATAILAAVGFADLSGIIGRGETQPWRRLWPLALLPAVSLVLGVGLTGLVECRPDIAPAVRLAPAREVLLGPLWLALATTAVLASARGHRLALVAIVAVAASDMALYGVEKIFHRSPPMTIETLIAREPTPPGRPIRRVRGGSNLLTMSGFDLAEGYLALTPRRMLDYDRVSALRVAGIGWSRSRRGPARWALVPDALPRARLVSRAVRSDDPRRDIERIALESTALLGFDPHLPGGPPGRAEIIADRPGTVGLVTHAGSRQLLILADSYHAGWRATIDGRPSPALRVNGDFLGCVVGPGRHEVLFRFAPRSLQVGGWLSALGVALTLISLGLIRRERRTNWLRNWYTSRILRRARLASGCADSNRESTGRTSCNRTLG